MGTGVSKNGFICGVQKHNPFRFLRDFYFVVVWDTGSFFLNENVVI